MKSFNEFVNESRLDKFDGEIVYDGVKLFYVVSYDYHNLDEMGFGDNWEFESILDENGNVVEDIFPKQIDNEIIKSKIIKDIKNNYNNTEYL